ncbi:Cytochrome c oxidase assembly protein cox19 [Microbotryomycetes sp. JL201]|nr:Cytochrome c oxidase assembly protein cox19 [Microbotryomycetes sp. JL201]
MSLTLKPTPPDYMKRYLDCMKRAKNQSTDCRHLSKEYLSCRMDKGLMERVEWDALGFQEAQKADSSDKV